MALLTSLIDTCKRPQMDPLTYLRDIFEPIGTHPVNRLDELVPDQWIAARAPATA